MPRAGIRKFPKIRMVAFLGGLVTPTGVEAFALDAHFLSCFRQEYLTQGGQILRPVVLAHSALIFSYRPLQW